MIKYIYSIIAFFSVFITNSLAQSPYSISLDREEAHLFIGSGLIGVYTNFAEKDISAPDKSYIEGLDKNDVNIFDRSATNNYSKSISTVSDVAVVALGASPLIFLKDKSIRSDFLTLAVMYSETMLYAYKIPRIAKVSVKRARPYLYNTDLSIDDKLSFGKDSRFSFFSNHTCVAFASASFITKVYSDYFPNSKWKNEIGVGAFGVAGFVGYLRYKSGMHFPSDVLTGAAVGAGIGYIIPYLHQKDKDDLGYTPIIDPINSRIGFALKF